MRDGFEAYVREGGSGCRIEGYGGISIFVTGGLS